jgi:hypothetical protein
MSFQIRLCGAVVAFSVALAILCQRTIGALLSASTLAFMSLIGYFATVIMIPVICKYMLKRKIYGLDINKKGTPGG